jgi:DNA-binding NarL/FixJ family response regulator
MYVLLAGDLERERRALKQLLEQDSELNVVGEATEAAALLAQLQESRPDLVLLEWGLPGLRADKLLPALRCLARPVKIVVFGERAETHQQALAAGADAFVSKQEPAEELLNTVRAVGGLSPCYV